MCFNDLRINIARAYSVLGLAAELQNSVDISNWESSGIISSEIAEKGRKYNHALAKKWKS